MKHLFTSLCLCLLLLSGASAQTSLNMSQLGHWRHPDPNVFYNDCWGYTANGREYAILGSSWGTHFLEVTNGQAVEIASIAGGYRQAIWRDFKTYGHYAYGVADGNSGNTLQIFDLSNLPNSVTKVYDSNALTHSAHNCFIDGNRLYLLSNRPATGGLVPVDILSLADPVNPVHIGSLSGAFFNGSSVHDAFVRNDTAYCSGEYSGLFVYDLRDAANPVLISSIPFYPYQGYNHSSWVSPDRRTVVFADEVGAGLPLKVYDMADLSNPVFRSTFQPAAGSTPHNPYLVGPYAVVSYYKAGLQVYDLTQPQNPVQIGYYDTYPDNGNDYTGDPYEGCWGTYPFLPSGNILASDITYGLFVLSPPSQLRNYVLSAPAAAGQAAVSVYPNPASGQFSVRMPEGASGAQFSLFNALGQQVRLQQTGSRAEVMTFDAAQLAPGLYTLRIAANGQLLTRKVVIR